MSADLTRDEVEEFLYWEAELLDDWRLPEWADLFTDDAVYEVTPLNIEEPMSARSADTLFIIADDKERLTSRAKRLMKKTAHAEYPHSKTRHMVGNVRVSPAAEDDCKVKANFVVYRTKGDSTARYMGEAHYLLVRDHDRLRIRSKRCVLDLDTLAEQGRLTIIL